MASVCSRPLSARSPSWSAPSPSPSARSPPLSARSPPWSAPSPSPSARSPPLFARSPRATQPDVFKLCEEIRSGFFEEQALLQERLCELHFLVQEVLAGTHMPIWTHDRKSRARRQQEEEITPTGFDVSSVEVVDGECYTRLRQRFEVARKRNVGRNCFSERVLTQEYIRSLDAGANEWLLLHGTTEDATQAIARYGFDLERARQDSTCGTAIYLAESSTKADEYASPKKAGDDRIIIFCRVLGGNVHYVDDANPNKDELLGCWDTVLNDRTGSRRTYREFVVRAADRVLPEVVVRYKHSGVMDTRPSSRSAVRAGTTPRRSRPSALGAGSAVPESGGLDALPAFPQTATPRMQTSRLQAKTGVVGRRHMRRAESERSMDDRPPTFALRRLPVVHEHGDDSPSFVSRR
mmetsp:Transcript_56531/g.163976  ORF Transcript_56531/g.163976 Transcript_56531/m.163976 type:complete len:408 (+) Transcript_56531:83-1306(+)